MAVFLLLFSLAMVIPFAQAGVVWNTQYTINPSVTDPNILDAQDGQPGFGAHTIYVNLSSPSVTAQPLFVFLAGTAVHPDGYENVLNTAASLGWKSVGLAWNNSHDPAELDVCANMALFVQDCQLEFRTDSLIGGINTDAFNSIIWRLYKLLIYMDQQYPTQGWNFFFGNANLGSPNTAQYTIVWNRMAWGGHSQGGGTAQLVAMKYPTRRVVMIAPSGIIEDTIPADTYTPIANYYMFAHISDTTEYVLDNTVSAGPLNDLAGYGAPLFVEDRTSFFPAHVLKTDSNATACAYAFSHSCVAFDTDLERDENNIPVFRPVWEYMIGNPIYLDASITPTPSVTPSRSSTPSISTSPSRSRTPSTTSSPSRTPSVTPSPSRTPSKTATPSRTPSKSATPSISTTPSPSRTPSVTPTPSRTPSVTPSVSPSISVSRTPSPSSPPSKSSTPSRTPSKSPSSSKSPGRFSSQSSTPNPFTVVSGGEKMEPVFVFAYLLLTALFIF